MRRCLRSSLRGVALASIAGLLLAAPAQADSDPHVGEKIFDAMVLRPLGFASTVVGLAFLVPAVLVSLPNGPEGREEAWGIFVEAPITRTFRRPLGVF